MPTLEIPKSILKLIGFGPAIYLVRHGKTALDSVDGSHDQFAGWTNVPLDEEGKREAEDIANFLSGRGISYVFSSDLARALETAETFLKREDVPLEISPAFRSWNLGKIEGKSEKEVHPLIENLVRKKQDYVPQGGESFNQFLQRFLPKLREVVQDVEQERLGTIAIFTHSHNLKAAQAWCDAGMKDLTIDENSFLKNGLSVGAILKLDWNPKRKQWIYAKFSLETEA
jgi:broad specificity phosphatase PhoE